MDLPDDKETFTLIKPETNESGGYFDTDIQDASKNICVPVSSFDHESLQISKIKEEVNADDCSLMIKIEKETVPDYISTVHTAYRDEPHMDDQPDNTFINKCIKLESSEHIVHHHTNMDMMIYAQQHIEKASVVIDSEFSNSTRGQCHINIDTIKTEVSGSSTQSCPKLRHEGDNLGHIDVFSTANANLTKLSSTKVNTLVFPECDQRYGKKFHLNQYILTDAEEINPCNNKCAQTNTVGQHMLTNYVPCDTNCTQTGGLHQHMLAPAKDRTYSCSKCCERFESHNFWQHMLTHADKKHACPDCDKRFTLAMHLERHMLIHTGKRKKQHTCAECGKKFSKASRLRRHMLIHTGEKQHACPECDKRFTQAGNLKKHMLIHTGEKQHACQDCGKRFTQTHNLKKHMLIHTGEKQHACPECGKRFPLSSHLKRHMLIHTGEKEHACPECDKRFPIASHLKRHLLIHTGEKQHACPDCDKRFTQAGDFTRHMLTHTGAKQHTCPECGKRFAHASYLKRHMLIHTGEKQHACPDCDKRFIEAGHLKRHMLTHTGEKQHACP